MAKYYITCEDVAGIDCDFRTEADTVELVIEQCAAHGRAEHGLRGFGAELFAKMRPHIRLVETGTTLPS